MTDPRQNHQRNAVVDTGASHSSNNSWSAFTNVMDCDLDTPAAIAVQRELADEILAGAAAGQGVLAAQQALRRMGAVFGLRLDHEGPEPRVVEGWTAHLERFT